MSYLNVSYLDIIVSATVVFFCAYFFACFLTLCKKKWVKTVAYTILISLFAVDFFLVQNFKMFISPNLLVLLAETDKKESTEFIHTFMGLRENIIVYSVVIGVIVLAWLFEKYYRTKLQPLFKMFVKPAGKRGISILVLITLGIGMYGMGTYIRLFNCSDTDELSSWDHFDPTYPHDPLSNTIYAFWGIHLMKNEMGEAIEATQNMDMNSICSEDSINVVFVIGESYIRKHAGIYGYTLNTTPNLQKEKEKGNLFVFKDVCSPFNLTSYVMKNILCCNSISEGEKWHEMPFMPAVFFHAGFKVMMWDNQRDSSPGASWTFALNSFLYNEEITKFYTNQNKQSFNYDEQIVNDFINKVDYKDSINQITIFHLVGQHSDASYCYPHSDEFCIFNADSIKRYENFLSKEKKEKIAQYDNATYYNDYVIKRIMDLYYDKNAVMVYLSDHGEEIYDYRDSEGRRGSNNVNTQLLEYQYSVPFIIWCSPKYQELHPETMETIRNAVDRPFMIDNVCQVLFHLGGIQTSYYKPERDLLNDKYRRPKRLVDKSIDYDQFVKQKP